MTQRLRVSPCFAFSIGIANALGFVDSPFSRKSRLNKRVIAYALVEGALYRPTGV